MPWPLYPQEKSPWYPTDRRLGGPQSQSECSGEEKNSQPLTGLEPPIIQPVAQHSLNYAFNSSYFNFFSNLITIIFYNTYSRPIGKRASMKLRLLYCQLVVNCEVSICPDIFKKY
jgi:hypothetical protein